MLSDLRGDLLRLLVMAVFTGATVSLGFPLLSFALERVGAGPLTVGVNAAAHSLGVLLTVPFLPRIVGAIGATACLRIGPLLAAVIFLAFPLHVDAGYWFGLRIILGVGIAFIFVLSEAGINALAPPERRGRILALYATLFSIGYTLGPLIVAVLGSAGWLPFVVTALIFTAGVLPTLGMRDVDRALAVVPHRASVRDIARLAPLALWAILVFALAETAFFALEPVWALGAGFGEAKAAVVLSVWISGNILLQLPIGWLADRWPKRRVLTLCTLSAAACAILMNAAVDAGVVLWPVLAILGGTMGGVYVMSLALLGDRFQGPDLAQASAAFVTTFQVGVLLGPVLAGGAMRAAGYEAFPYLLALPMLLLGILPVGVHRRLTGRRA